MTNYEHFREQIEKFTRVNVDFALNKETKKIVICDRGFNCLKCEFFDKSATECTYNCANKKLKWADEEYVEPKVDWANVPIDTKVFVKDSEDDKWLPRYFAGYNDKRVRTWDNGVTSFSAKSTRSYSTWNYAKLANENLI